MSFAKWVEEEEKKKKKKTVVPSTYAPKNTSSNTYFSDWVADNVVFEEEDDIAPVRSTVSMSPKLGEDKTGYPNIAGSAVYTFNGTPIQAAKDKSGKYFDDSFLDDGWQWSDLKVLPGSLVDATKNLAQGAGTIFEKIIDVGAMAGTAMQRQQMMEAAQSEMMTNAILGKKDESVLNRYLDYQDEAEKGTAKFVAKNLIDEAAIAKAIISDPVKWATGLDSEKDSLFANKSDELIQSGGQYLADAGVAALANYALPGSGVFVGKALAGATAFGGEAENAFNNGATFNDAFASAGVSAGGEILTEIIGGLNFGGKTITDAMADSLSKKITGKVGKALLAAGKFGANATAEGVEEIASGYISAIGQKLTYMDDKELEELFSNEDVLDSFIGGFVLGGFGEGFDVARAKKNGVSYVTGLTKNEQAVLDKEIENRIAEQEKNGNKLTGKEKSKIADRVREELERGYISTDTIESALGGDSYKAYKDALDNETSLVEQEKALTKEYDDLNGKRPLDRTGEEWDRIDELKTLLPELRAKIKTNEESNNTAKLKSKLFSEVEKLTAKDSKLRESYNELVRSTQDFKADFDKFKGTKHEEAARKTIESAIKLKANNTNKVHDIVDLAAHTAAESGKVIEFKSNEDIKNEFVERQTKKIAEYEALENPTAEESETLANMRELLEKVQSGKTIVNGNKTGDTIVVNIDSDNALNCIVGHEITHGLEKAKSYGKLGKHLFSYAKSKGVDTDALLAEKKLEYEGVEDADPEAELVADLVGDYLFTDYDYVLNLTTSDRNLAQKVYDTIKHLFKMATAGSKEARELERVKYAFENAFREAEQSRESNEIGDTDTQYAIRESEPPKETGVAYKVFFVKDGKLYPPMVANPDGADTPMGVWLDADVGKAAPPSKTGRAQVKAGGKGTQGGSGSLAFRPGWHLGDLPRASQFDRVNPETGKKELFPENFVWAEVEYAKDVDYQEEAMSYGYTENGKFRHAYAGLPRLPENGYYRYRTNPKPDTVPWIITGSMKVNRLLSDAEVNQILEQNGVAPVHRQGGDVELDKFGFGEDTKYSFSSISNSFFGEADMTSNAFKKRDYKQTEGYNNYVNQCLDNYKQTKADFAERENEYRKEIEDSIDGIVRVAIAAKEAGYDIFDDATKRNTKDSKNRLLFSSLEPNSDYFTSSDISTICDKRQNFAEIYDDIVRAEEKKGVPKGKRFFDNVDNYFYLHAKMAEKGLTTPCRQCYVESMRKNLAPMASAFLRLVNETNPNNTANDQLYQQSGKNKGTLKSNNAKLREKVLDLLAEYDMSASDLTVETLTTEDGLAQLKIQAPLVYEAFNSFYGQSKPKMPKSATPFRFGELTALLTDEKGRIKQSLVDKINSTGGFRLQSYSDFQIQNYTDVLQVIFEAGTLGLNGHAYTKVPAFLEATKGTNLKRNISIFMYKDGSEWKLDRNDSFPYSLEEIYDLVKADKTGNTGIIAVSQNDDMSAWIMANDLVGYGIPFHKSGLKMGVVRDTDVKTEDGRIVKGYSGTKDHTKQQTEVWAKTTADHKALTKVKNGINIYGEDVGWDFANEGNLSKNELIEKNVKAYIDACERAGYLPKFRDYVMNNGKVLENVLKYAKELGYASQTATIDDISFQYKGYTIPYGYYKFLGDFGMFTPDGKASPQETLSLNSYNFGEAERFFADAEKLRRNEVLQQFANGEVREDYRSKNLSAEELLGIVKQKRSEVVESVVPKYSLSDSDGNALSKEQQEFFKDSKVRDGNGNLLALYHGSKSYGFTVFKTFNDREYSAHFGTKEAASRFADDDHTYKVYLNIKNPIVLPDIFGENTLLRDYVKKIHGEFKGDIKTVFGRDLIEVANTPEELPMNRAFKQYAEAATEWEYDDGSEEGAVWVSKLAQKYLLSLGYDGIAYKNAKEDKGSTSYAVFNSNQIKSVDNHTPTEYKDIHYSLSDSNGNELSPAVQNRFAKSKVVDENGSLKVVYHGTATGEFTIFDKAKGSVEGDFGSGFYFTDNEYDVERNYEGGGPDFENKIDRRAEQIEAEEDISYAAARKRAIQELYVGSHKFEVYLNIENPAVVGKTTLLDYESFAEEYDRDDYDSDEDYESDVEYLISDKIDEIIWEVEKNVDVYSTDGLADVLWNAVNEGGVDIEQLKANINELYLEDSNGNMVGNEVTRQIIESLGYDGIIDPTVSGKWNMEMEAGTTHYIVFKPNQIKNVSNQNPTDNPDINLSLSSKDDDIAPVGGYDFYGKDFRKKPADSIAPIAETAKATAKVTTQVVGATEDEAPVNEATKRSEVESVVGNRDGYVSKKAMSLYEEVKGMKKGVRVSKELSYLLGTLDLSDANKADSYRSLRTALLNIRDNPNQVVNPNSAIESMAREMIGREYDAMVEDFVNAEGVTGNIYTKMQALRTELENNQRLREQSSVDFDNEIARLQAVYDGKKDKNTKVANDILRRIERIKRLKSQVDADFGKRIEKTEARLEKMSKPEYKTAMQRKKKQAEYTSLMENLVGNTATWVDKKLGLSYKVNTLRRNLRDIVKDANGDPDIAKADAIYDELQGKYNHNEAELKRESMRIKEVFQKLKLNHTEASYAHMLGEFRHNPSSKLTEEDVKDYYNKNKRKIDTAKVDKAIDESRKVFDELYDRLNERLREQGMKEIPYRQGYFPHFQNPKQKWYHKYLNWKPVDNEIPTSIAGLTEDFNPERSWQSFNKERKSDVTDYDLTQALDGYIHGALDWIYHIEDLQKRRALENHIRYVHSEEGVKKRIDKIRNDETYDADEAQAMIDAVFAEAKNPLNNFVTDLRAGTNTLANKKSSMDRKTEEATNRKIYSVMTNLNNRINANMVVGSFSSALTNFIPITQSWMEVSPVYSLKGMRDTIISTIRDDGVVNKSDFLTNRFMNEEKLYQTGWDKVSEKAAIMMEAIDSFTSQTVWRSKYLQNISEGMSETEAIKNADQFAENVIAGRSRGNQPTIFDAKNPFTKIFTAFQLEVANQYGYMFKDAPQDSVNKARLVKGYATAFLGAYAYNALYSSLVGRDAAFDPISILEDLFKDLFGDDEEDEDALLNLAENVLDEVPFVGGLVGGGRIPLSSAIPYSNDNTPLQSMVADVKKAYNDGQPFEDVDNFKPLANEMLKPIYYLLPPFGGGQAKKTNEGLGMFSDDHPVSGSYTESGNLRFPVEDTLGNRVQAAMFGQYASKNARDYFDNGRSPLKEKQIQEYIDVDIPISDYWKYREGLTKQKTVDDKFDYIAGLDLPVSKKNILINNIVDRKEDVDMTGYEDFSSYDEFDFATKNPGKYAVSQAVGDYSTYSSYYDHINDLTADKDESGKSINGSRKEKVFSYIDSLPLDYGQKCILFKSEYKSDDSMNMDIINYLDSREDIDYNEMVTIITELGFTVNGNNVYWD